MPRTRVALAVAACALLLVVAGAAEKMKPEEVVARHLAAVGPKEALASGRSLQGAVDMSAPSGGTGVAGALVGRFTFESEASRFALLMKFPSEGYPAEGLSFEGGKPDVAFVRPGKRSGLGTFVNTNAAILGEGLLGGVLNARWPLFALAERSAKVSYEGLKKYEGRELHRLRYRAKKGQGDLEVALYFEPDTFRHVASVYRESMAQNMGSTPESSSSQPDIYLQMTETFSDFKTARGMALPTRWTIRYEMQAKVTQHWKYTLAIEGMEE
jgi:hypothetical protein